MDTRELRAAHDHFLAVARAAAARAGGAGRRTNAQIVAHIIASDRLLANTVALVLAGRPATYDGTMLDVRPYIDSIVDSAPTYLGLIAVAETAAGELCAVLRAVDAIHESALVRMRIVSEDRVMKDEDVPLARLVETHAGRHLASHAEEVATTIGVRD